MFTGSESFGVGLSNSECFFLPNTNMSVAGENFYENQLIEQCGDDTIKTTIVSVSRTKNDTKKQNNGELKTMTSYVVAKNKNGIVLAVDSRDTIRNSRGIIKYNDNFEKLVYLEKAGFLVLNSGNNHFAGMEFSTWIKLLESKLKGKTAQDAIKFIAQKALTDANGSREIFVVVQTSNMNSYSVRIENTEEFSLDNSIKEIKNGSFVWLNPLQVDMVNTIYDESLFTGEKQKDNTIRYAVDIPYMSFSTLCDFCRHIVQMHIDLCKFHEFAFPVVGGNINIMGVKASGEVVKYSIPSQMF